MRHLLPTTLFVLTLLASRAVGDSTIRIVDTDGDIGAIVNVQKGSTITIQIVVDTSDEIGVVQASIKSTTAGTTPGDVSNLF